MGLENNEEIISSLLAELVEKIAPFLREGVMDSFDVNFEYEGNIYLFSLKKTN